MTIELLTLKDWLLTHAMNHDQDKKKIYFIFINQISW